MASKIEHYCKWDSYMRTVTWGNGLKDHPESILFLPKEKMKAHRCYIEQMEKEGSYFYGSPPRSRFLNWLGHKCLELAWGRSIYR